MTDLGLLDSITDAAPAPEGGGAGGVAVSGSHGGTYPAAVASRAGLAAVIFNDAGIGRDRAGVAGLAALDGVGVAAAAADGMTCRIGSAADMMAGGVVSTANGRSAALGVAPGMPVRQAAALLAAAFAGAPSPPDRLPAAAEARSVARVGGVEVRLLDSASLVGAEDAGRIVVTGSHGGLIGGDPARALKAAARLAVFNDAGGGKDGIGFTRLPALAARGIAAATVSAMSARIGDAASMLETGVISAVNGPAAALGLAEGRALAASLAALDPA